MTTSASPEAAPSASAREFRTVGVIGLGTMGAGIAEVFARNGVAVVGVEINEDALSRGRQHLEQLSVLPAQGRRGIGGALVAAALEEARWAGYDEMSLCTYRDVPWNGPFYARLGFEPVEHLAAHQQRLRDHEVELGLDADGVRVVMSRRL